MSTSSRFLNLNPNIFLLSPPLFNPKVSSFPIFNPPLFSKSTLYPHHNAISSSPIRKTLTLVFSKSFESEEDEEQEGKELSSSEDQEWLNRLPDKTKPVYSHSLPCIEAWLKTLGFYQSNDDRSVWFVEKQDWRAQLSLDVTDLYIRYLKNGPGNLEKDVERRFSYALSREDIENAILGGP